MFKLFQKRIFRSTNENSPDTTGIGRKQGMCQIVKIVYVTFAIRIEKHCIIFLNVKKYAMS